MIGGREQKVSMEQCQGQRVGKSEGGIDAWTHVDAVVVSGAVLRVCTDANVWHAPRDLTEVLEEVDEECIGTRDPFGPAIAYSACMRRQFSSARDFNDVYLR